MSTQMISSLCLWSTFTFPKLERHHAGTPFAATKASGPRLGAPKIGQIRTRMVRTPHVRRAMDALAAAKNDSKASLARVRVFPHPSVQRSHPARISRYGSQPGARHEAAARRSRRRNVCLFARRNTASPESPSSVRVDDLCRRCLVGLRRGEIFRLRSQDSTRRRGSRIRREVTFDQRGRMVVTEPKTEAARPRCRLSHHWLRRWRDGERHNEQSREVAGSFQRHSCVRSVRMECSTCWARRPSTRGTSIRDRSNPCSAKRASCGAVFTRSAVAWLRTCMRSRFRTSTFSKSCVTLPWTSRGNAISRA